MLIPFRNMPQSTFAVDLGVNSNLLCLEELLGRKIEAEFLANEPLGIYFKNFANETQRVGGPSKFYGAAMYRMRESDFRSTQHEAGESPAWPISYADLEPYYCDVEQ